MTSKWQLAVHDQIAHLIAMPHVTRKHVDRLVEDLAARQLEEARPSDVIAEMIEAVAVAGVNIETLDSETTDGTVVAILTVDRFDEACGP